MKVRAERGYHSGTLWMGHFREATGYKNLSHSHSLVTRLGSIDNWSKWFPTAIIVPSEMACSSERLERMSSHGNSCSSRMPKLDFMSRRSTRGVRWTAFAPADSVSKIVRIWSGTKCSNLWIGSQPSPWSLNWRKRSSYNKESSLPVVM